MLFNSFSFFYFFTIVYVLYRMLGHRNQNLILLLSSYFFYGCWDWRFLSLIFVSTTVDYVIGLSIAGTERQTLRKKYVLISVLVNLGILGFFKYYSFFIESLMVMLSKFGIEDNAATISILLPVGISFYTFQTMTYSIDIYRKNITPTRNFIDFALFVSFFPQLVAGPIERAKSLLPQVTNPRRISRLQIERGLWLILWGLFKKVVIADNVALIVNEQYSQAEFLNGPNVVIAAYAFYFQIYCDFSGYSDIARGVSKILGFDLMMNFNIPFIASNPADFWKRWHISLSSWLRDYLYIPLGGNRKGKIRTYWNLMVTMLLGGLWHGAAWIFVIWGAYQGILLVIHKVSKSILDTIVPNNRIFKVITIITTFHLMCFGWLIFRSESLDQLLILSNSLIFAWSWSFFIHSLGLMLELAVLVWPLLLIQMVQVYTEDLDFIVQMPSRAQEVLYAFIIYMIFVYGALKPQEFIYFQF